EKYPKLANNMAKRLGYGDFIKVYGHILNQTILVEDNSVEEDSEFEDWGGDEEIKSEFENNYIKQYISELQIISVDSKSYEKKKYNEEDFISEDESIYNGDFDDDSEEGEGDPFSDESDVDDLPFD